MWSYRVVVRVEQPDGDPEHADLHATEQPTDQRNQRLHPQRLRRAGWPLLGRALAGRRRSAGTRLQDEHEAGYLDPCVLPPWHRHPYTLEPAVHQPQPEDGKSHICRGRVDLHVLDLENAGAQPNLAVVEVEDRPKQKLEQAAEERSHPFWSAAEPRTPDPRFTSFTSPEKFAGGVERGTGELSISSEHSTRAHRGLVRNHLLSQRG